MGHSRHLFLDFRCCNTVDIKCSILIFANDWIWTENLWNWKRLLYQLSHNHCPQWTCSSPSIKERLFLSQNFFFQERQNWCQHFDISKLLLIEFFPRLSIPISNHLPSKRAFWYNLKLCQSTILPCPFRAWWRNKMHEMNDTLYSNNWSIYTIKETPIRGSSGHRCSIIRMVNRCKLHR